MFPPATSLSTCWYCSWLTPAPSKMTPIAMTPSLAPWVLSGRHPGSREAASSHRSPRAAVVHGVPPVFMRSPFLLGRCHVCGYVASTVTWEPCDDMKQGGDFNAERPSA